LVVVERANYILRGQRFARLYRHRVVDDGESRLSREIQW
jgi:hypothetical protein